MSKSLNIVFMGTPEFAVASLDALVKSRHKVIGVVTVPDKPASRGLKLQSSAVKDYGVKNNLPVLQPEKLKNDSFLHELKALNADLFVVVAFRMLPEVVWKMPKLGTINLHASLLPNYRGAAPINWAVINGEKETGATTFFITQEIDTGDILLQERITISEEDNAGSIHDRLMEMGSNLLVKTVDAIADETVKAVKQNLQGEHKPAPKIFRETCKINWNKPSVDVFNFVRGLSPYPGAWTEWTDSTGQKSILKIYKTKKQDSVKVSLSKAIADGDNRLFIGCADHALEILELQPEGRKRMIVADFLRGIQSGAKTWDVSF
jgi:methionyl-tRNA formyltransferase